LERTVSTYYIAAASLTGSIEQLDRYLYSHTQRVITITAGESLGTAALLLTQVENDTDGRESRHLAKYQTGRLESGLWFARTFDSSLSASADEDFLYLADIIAKRSGLPNPFRGQQ
jgi:hypothetical protein